VPLAGFADSKVSGEDDSGAGKTTKIPDEVVDCGGVN
jgi:hypothetical protein